ncbi:MAG: DUF4268 domain-containing protein [Anaerotruncus sp.]|nr:DUF4268 domain-containing protein [Anaerotruncus sp.]
MKGSERKLVAYMEGSNKRFVIPVYQRNYDWKTENCKQLYDDLVKVTKSRRKSHFFGSIVSVYNPDGRNEEYLIIDGQQRLTTVSLLFLAMYNLIIHKILTPATASLGQRIYEEYLVDKWAQQQETRIKLKPIKDDQTAFQKLFDEDSEPMKASNLTINYNYFYDRIQKQEITLDELFDAIGNLEIINIMLNGDDNPQLIFESLNSTGLALSEGDKIRNFILMGLPPKQQNEFYEKYWNKIELCTNYDVSAFIRDYLSVKRQSTPSLNKIYFTFKAYVGETEPETEALLKELLLYARHYEILLKGNTTDKKLNACIYRLNKLETTVTRPFFLEVLRLLHEGKLKLFQVAEVFLTTESYLFRRTICDLPTNALNKIFLLLHKEIVRFDGTEDNYVEKFYYALLSKKERARFPDNTEFIEAFANRQIYLMNAKNKIYILERFENYGTIEDKDIYRHFDDDEYSIEHIMPQHLTPAWADSLGDDCESIHEQWLHRIGNLTLIATSYNSKYSNSTFEEKKTMPNGFNESGIRLNAYIAQKSQWGLAELEDRTGYLMNRAIEIWAMPSPSYQPLEKQLDSYTLDDDISLSKRQIVSFRFKNIEQPVTSWIDMYEHVLRILHAEDKSILAKLAYTTDENVELAPYVSEHGDNLRRYRKIDSNIFIERNTSTDLKLSLLRRFFKLYNEDAIDLVFYLKSNEDTPDAEPSSALYQLRKSYWTYALPVIKKAHKKGELYAHVSPSKDNWIAGFFGVGGFSISCVANFDSARVELSLSKSDKSRNKTVYDSLFQHKDAIEQALGVSLRWLRNDEINSSSIAYILDNVSIKNETDWFRMANFHAEWSKKFYDVLTPYLK